ncbi:MAG TPA: flagellar protein FlaG [Anaerolineaceae bacterium]
MVDQISPNLSPVGSPASKPQAEPSFVVRHTPEQPKPVVEPPAAGKPEQAAANEKNSSRIRSEPQSVMDIRVQFELDPKTSDLTVLVVDRENKRVVRTIPPEDLDKYKDSGIFDLFA